MRAFRIRDKVDMGTYGVHDLGIIVTDHFFSNFNNDSEIIDENLNMKRIFDEKIKIDFNPEWDMARLPLQKGEIAKYYNKYIDYKSQIENEKLPLVNFSNPIFASNNHIDNFGYFIKERLDSEFGILTVDQYRLYGNLKGYYPINTEVLGGFTKENLKRENIRAINNFVINTHGQMDNIDSSYFTTADKESEVRESLVNITNVNEVLNHNYYNLFLWDCWGSADLSDTNITQTMLSKGKAVNVIASSYLTSNNGINVYDTLEELKGNNGISLFYGTMKGIYHNNYSWSESFNRAKRDYIKYNLADKSNKDGNYQFNMNNAIGVHYLGLLEKSDKSNVIYESIRNPEFVETAEMTEMQAYIYRLMLPNMDSEFKVIVKDDDVIVSMAKDETYLYIKADSNKHKKGVFFLAGDTPGLKKPVSLNDDILKIPLEEVYKYEADIMLSLYEIGKFVRITYS